MAAPRRVAILGCTGSVGRQTADVVRAHPELFRITALAAHRDEPGLAALAAEFGVRRTGLGTEAAVSLAASDDVDVVLNGVVGSAGLAASVAALAAGKVLALANKESLVAGGEVCLAAARRGGGVIAPVDSEHAAIAQCLEGVDRAALAEIVLTASGGPFRARPDPGSATPGEALAHPTWRMGPKITVDSATLMNKGLEVIEAHHLFALGYDRIRVLVHPQSIVHGIVLLRDGSQLMQAALPDMRLPIQSALAAPERVESPVEPLDLGSVGVLSFEPVDHRRFPSVGLAYEAGRAGRSYPAVLNAANEESVRAFLEGEISFADIPAVTRSVLDRHDPVAADELDPVLEVDAWARAEARRAIRGRRHHLAGATEVH
jgi:1-deoxy-D-xylulose-5-phosphate reductoisomerase